MADNNSCLNLYSSAIESEIGSIFQHGRPKNWKEIEEKLQNCAENVQFLITHDEHEQNNFLFHSVLHQIKYELELVLQIVQDKAAKQYNSSIASTALGTSYFEDNNDKSKRRKLSKTEDSKNFIKNSGETPTVGGLKDIVGLCDIKRTLNTLIILRKNQPQLFEKVSCNTILLYGPPGTGKTRLVHAIAAEAKATLHCLRGSDVLSQYVGETEKGIKAFFQLGKNSDELVILFIDEVDGFCRKRNPNEQEYSRRMKTELMCQFSSADNCANLIVIGATNCPWDLDTAILRRFQRHIYVPLPNRIERLEFFRYFTKDDLIDQTFDEWFPLLERTEGFSGSDLSNLVQNAFDISLNELEETKIWKLTEDGFYEPVRTKEDFCNAVYCKGLENLPSKTVKARKMNMSDLMISAENVIVTVPPSDVVKYESFKGN